MSREAQLWVVLLAVSCVSLFYYSRHLSPYDAAMTFGLGALYLGLARGGGWPRSAVVGALAGAAFITYLAYWALAIVVVLWGRVAPG